MTAYAEESRTSATRTDYNKTKHSLHKLAQICNECEDLEKTKLIAISHAYNKRMRQPRIFFIFYLTFSHTVRRLTEKMELYPL